MLVTNTEQLIARFETERADALERQRADEEIAVAMRRSKAIAHTLPAVSKRSREQFTPEERAAVEPDALKILKARLPGLDFYSPGFNGLLQSEIDRILRERMA